MPAPRWNVRASAWVGLVGKRGSAPAKCNLGEFRDMGQRVRSNLLATHGLGGAAGRSLRDGRSEWLSGSIFREVRLR